MEKVLLEELRKITEEELLLLNGQSTIDRGLYQTDSCSNISDGSYVIDAKKLLDSGKLISIRKHTRFVHFPEHTHNYIEVIYMCSGSTQHVVNGTDIVLNTGEILFLNPNAVQEIYPADYEDIAVNFIILPQFFDYAMKMMEKEENVLRAFLVDAMIGKNAEIGYLHFHVADILPIQNLIENLIWTIMNRQPNKRSISQMTMGLLLVQLLNYMDVVETDGNEKGQKLVVNVLRYIEENYRDGDLAALSDYLHYDFYWLSKEIKKRTGQTYIELVQTKRLSQAGYLLSNTAVPISEIALAVGYENVSYFHRLFRKKYGMTPREYRLQYK